MKWLMDIVDRRKSKKTLVYKADALPDGETRTTMIAKADAPTNAMGMSAGTLIEHWRMYGSFTKIECKYSEPATDATTLCAGCMFFIRQPWSESDSCQICSGACAWYGTCNMRIDANEQAAIVYAEDIGEYAEKAKDAKARALPVALSGGVSEDKWDGAAMVAEMDAAMLKKCCLAFVGGDTDKKGNYKLPYREAGGKINAAAVRAIKAVLGGARGGVELPESIRADVEANADKLMAHVKTKATSTKKQYRITINPMESFVGGSFVAKSLADGVTEISGRLSSGGAAVYAYTMADDAALARGRAMIDKEATQTVEVEESVSLEIPIAKSDAEKRIVYGVVMQPDVEDLHGDIMSADDIEKACHTYTAYCRKVNDQHDAPIKADVVENYISPVDFIADNGSVVKKGSWVQVTKVVDDKMWAMIQSGERTAYSYEGWGVRTAVA